MSQRRASLSQNRDMYRDRGRSMQLPLMRLLIVCAALQAA